MKRYICTKCKEVWFSAATVDKCSYCGGDCKEARE